MKKHITDLAVADQELARITEQQDYLKEMAPYNPIQNLAYQMGTLIQAIQAAKVKSLEIKCNTK